jgi:urease subunit gamma/beta
MPAWPLIPTNPVTTMHLTPKETDRLLLFLAAELARRRLNRGVRLNYPEARALIADDVLEGARDGVSVAELMTRGAQLLTSDDVLPGVETLMGTLQVEGMFPDGQKLVTIHDPIRPGPDDSADRVLPGQIDVMDGEIEISAGRETAQVNVANAGDRPVQVGSHFHFFEVNSALRFDRRAAFGMRLDIPAGTSVRFEPGEARDVALVAFAGTRNIHGLNGLTSGEADRVEVRDAAYARLDEFLEADGA